MNLLETYKSDLKVESFDRKDKLHKQPNVVDLWGFFFYKNIETRFLTKEKASWFNIPNKGINGGAYVSLIYENR